MNIINTFKTKLNSKALLLALIVILVFLFVANVFRFFSNKNVVNETQAQTTENSAFETIIDPIYSDPTRLKIDSVGIDMQLVDVGVTPSGALDTPKVFTEGGWYTKSSKPGETGNIIINAHYDDYNGYPAAFWQLKNVQINDTVSLFDTFGRKYLYKISDVYYVDMQDPDRLAVFESDPSKKEITLITCGGVYFLGSGYSKRLVAKGELLENY